MQERLKFYITGTERGAEQFTLLEPLLNLFAAKLSLSSVTETVRFCFLYSKSRDGVLQPDTLLPAPFGDWPLNLLFACLCPVFNCVLGQINKW